MISIVMNRYGLRPADQLDIGIDDILTFRSLACYIRKIAYPDALLLYVLTEVFYTINVINQSININRRSGPPDASLL